MITNKSLLLEKSENKGLAFKIKDPKTNKIIYQIRERKKDITKSRTQYFLIGEKHTQYISSIYPTSKGTTFSGEFDINTQAKYEIEYKALQYTLDLNGNTCKLLGGHNAI